MESVRRKQVCGRERERQFAGEKENNITKEENKAENV